MLVLLAEDHEDSRVMLTDALSLSGFNVRAFANGKDLLDAIYGATEGPFVVVTDLMMPVSSGFDVIANLRQDGLLDVVPVIVLSALESDHEGVTRLSKPLDLPKLFREVESAIARAVAAADTARIRLARARQRNRG